jgi:SAM-dependent methyltransferase
MGNTLYDRASDYDDQYIDYTVDIAFWEWAADQYSAETPIVEFACGTGRVTLPLLRRGYRVIGVDLSETMLGVFKRKLSLAPELSVELFHGDMCSFETGQTHNLVFVPFTSFLHVMGVEDQIRALRNFHSHLQEDGHLIIDIFNPSMERLAHGLTRYGAPTFEKRVVLPNGNLLVRYQTTRYFPAVQQAQWTFYIEIYDGETQDMIRKYTEEACVQVIFPNEWRMLLRQSGFEIVHEFGDFDRNPFHDTSPRMLFVARKI